MKKIGMMILVLALTPSAVFAADPSKAQVVTFRSNNAICLASVAIKQIDGHLRQLPKLGFEIEPGWHSMHGLATLDLKNCPVVEDRIRRPVNIPPLEWLFEAGRVYYVGLDHSSASRENWRLVVWKVEYMDGSEDVEGLEDIKDIKDLKGIEDMES